MEIVKLTPKNYFGSNSYLLSKGDDAILIDCSIEIEDILKVNKNIKIKAVLLTHCHFDHILFVNEICEHFNCPVYVLNNCENKLKDAKQNLSFESDITLLLNNNIIIKTFNNGDNLLFLNEKIEVFKTKGHS